MKDFFKIDEAQLGRDANFNLVSIRTNRKYDCL
jgi:hypothetical protein